MKLTAEEKRLIEKWREKAALEKRLGKYGESVRGALVTAKAYHDYLAWRGAENEGPCHPGWGAIADAMLVLADLVNEKLMK